MPKKSIPQKPNLIEFFLGAGTLKRIPRSGWVNRGVKDPESIADHTFRMALIAWFVGRGKNLDLLKLLKMALVHDLCEVYAGDATPHDRQIAAGEHLRDITIFDRWPLRLPLEEKAKIAGSKKAKEHDALVLLISRLPLELADEIYGLWEEYEDGLSREGVFLRQVDRVENVLQACEYEKEQKGLHMGSFWEQIKELADDPDLVEFIDEVGRYFYSRSK